MTLNFNVSPYYDDFDETKNYHRILFKPGVAVQARELTQAQTILQDQVTKFADNIFKQNSPVTGGQITTNFNVFYIKLQSTYNNSAIDVTQFNGLLVQNSTGTVIARVLAVASATGTNGVGDPPTLIVTYQTGNHFQDNDYIYDTQSNLTAQALSSSSTGKSSVASISQGVFYVLGNFVQVSPSTIILSKYNNSPSARLGLNITETIHDYINDSSLLDPAIGATNYQAPGADRYYIGLNLETRSISLGDDQSFIELVRITDGNVFKMVDGSVYATIDDYFAKRDYETNGDYVVNDFKLTPKTASDSSQYTLSVGKGLAYVRGYRVENPTPVDLAGNRARTTNVQINEPVFMDYGNYFYISNFHGANSSTFDITSTQAIDLHCVDYANVNISTATAYTSTLVGTGYIRGLSYDHSTIESQSNTYVYKAYVYNLQANTLSGNAVSSTATTVTLPSNFSSVSNAYSGVIISVTNGTDSGEFRTITSYNGSTKVATINQSWSVNPDTTSVMTLNFDTTSVESIFNTSKTSYPATINGYANIDVTGKSNGLASGYTILENPVTPELIFPIGNPYVANVTSGSYTTVQEWRNISFTTSGATISAQLSYTGDYLGVITHLGNKGTNLSSDVVKQNFIIVVTNKGTNTTINVGDIIPWTTTVNSNRVIGLNSDGSIATISTATSDLTSFTATIYAKVYVNNASDTNHMLKIKNLITANTSVINSSNTQIATYTFVDDTSTSTGQVYIQNAGIVSPGNKQSLYLSDVKNIVKIIDTKSPTQQVTLSMLSNPLYDVTSYYIFDNGQRDNYYDHASITLSPGAPKAQGNLFVLVNYYKHSGGDGYFSKMSYIDNSTSPEDYRQIPIYTSKNGTSYSLRDCLDFRPARLNAQTLFAFRYSNPGDTTKYGVFLPVDLGIFTCNYAYYLGRKDKLVLTKDKSLQIVEGTPSLNPIFPNEPDGSLVLAQMSHNPYTGFIPTEAPNGVLSDLSVEKVQHKRYTMSDIASLETRINRVEYYTSLNGLEQNANSLQIPDAYGLNRFKNGIMVDDFSSYAATDTSNNDFLASINKRTRQMSASQNVFNFPLKNIALAYNLESPSTSTISGLNYSITSDNYVNYFSLPYTTTNIISQKLASRTVNINPFSTSTSTGLVALSPNIDNWVDTSYSPSLLITDPNLQVFQQSSAVNILSVGDWQTVSGTTYLSGQSQSSSSTTGASVLNHGAFNGPFGNIVGYTPTYVTTTTTSTYTTQLSQQQNNIVGPYTNINNTYSLNNGYITDISILPWIRPQQIAVSGSGLLTNTQIYSFFDNISVDNYIRKPNIIELSGVSGTFNVGDVLGYVVSGTPYPTARILGIHYYPNSSTTLRLYVAADGTSASYTNTSTIQNLFFDQSGNYNSTTASGTLSSSSHYGGVIRTVGSTTSITLSALASSTDIYSGSTLYVVSGTGQGQSSVISSYNTSTKVATLTTAITCSVNDTYSIGTFVTNEDGSFYGIFNIPKNTFHTGQRVFRLDNRFNNDIATVTTYGEGTFYAEGLSTNKQNIDFGASPAGAKGTFVQTNQQTVSYTTNYTSSQTKTYYTPYDPVAQTFIIDPTNYPNGAFLSSINLFFASKPSDATPVTLSIVGTLNGYPNGSTLDHSIVTLMPSQVNVSTTPQYLDSTSYTTFKFNTPVYIQPGVLYSLIVKSNSNQYTLYTAANGDTALSSSVKNLPTDGLPQYITKISSAPYVGGLFISQNSQTWTADQNQSLMFTVQNCIFDITQTPSVRFVVPKKLPQRTLIDQSVDYFINANNSTIGNNNGTSNNDILVDAFNVTTTDFVPTSSAINYTYDATLTSGSSSGQTGINPGKYGTSMYDHIYLNDNKGERLLQSNSTSSFSLYAQLYSTDPYISPIISDAGTTLYAIQNNINNCPLSNSLITVTSSGTNYNANTTSVTISAPTGENGVQAYAAANVVNGNVSSIYITSAGSGYITTPTFTLIDANTTPGTGCTFTITGETSSHGGPATSKYMTKKVVLDAGFDSGDLNVYVTAYRPVGTDILVYYKILSRTDTQKFDDGSWQLMTKTNSSDTLYSTTRNDLHEFTFAPGTGGLDQGYVSYTSINGQTYNSFSQFALKVVLVTTDNTNVPYLSDFRCIALPSTNNTSV